MVGTFGHYIFKDGRVSAREATSSVQTVVFSSRMAGFFALGRYSRQIFEANRKFRLFCQGEIQSQASPEMFSMLGDYHESRV